MTLKLESKEIGFRFHPSHGRWIVHHLSIPSLWIGSAPICITWHSDRSRGISLLDHPPTSYESSQRAGINVGTSSFQHLIWEKESMPIRTDLEFHLLSDHPLLLWRTTLRNISQDPLHLDRITLLHAGYPGPPKSRTASTLPDLIPSNVALPDGGLSMSTSMDALAFFSNGWQSWNYSGTLTSEDRFPRTRLGPLIKPMRLNKGTPHLRGEGHFHSDMFAILGDRHSRRAWLAGFLSQRQAFGLLEGWVGCGLPAMRMWAELDGVRLMPGDFFVTDWAAVELVDVDRPPSSFHYVTAVSIQNEVKIRHASQTGWSSWYHAFEEVTQEHVRLNAEWLGEYRATLPLDLVQLDDGYEQKVGDWFETKETFPQGLEGIGEIICGSKAVPGLWLAPFVAARGSSIARRRKEWILKNRMGFPVNPGFIWDSFPYVLDISRADVLDHIGGVINTIVHEMGFRYLKLDFLYAGALNGVRSNPKITRAQALYRALRQIRKFAGADTQLLGCGCPLGSGIGHFDFMRINPDVAPHWLPKYAGIGAYIDKEEGLPAARNALLSAINRSFMHKNWWINDPDCILVRDKDSDLTKDEVQTFATVISMSAGSIIASDHLPDLSEERIEWLAKMLPPFPHAADVLDWFDSATPSRLMTRFENESGEWCLLAVINWNDEPADMEIDIEDLTGISSDRYHVVDFWNKRYRRMHGANLLFPQVAAHGVRFVSIRPVEHGVQWVGSTLHTSQGLCLQTFRPSDHQLSLDLDLHRRGSGEVWLQIPSVLRDLSFNQQSVSHKMVDESIVRIHLQSIGKGKLIATWD